MGRALDRTVLGLGLATVGLAVALVISSPAAVGTLPLGFVTPVLVLELATGPEWLDAVLGDPAAPGAAEVVAGWVRACRLDLVFMIAYSAFLGAYAVQRGVGRVGVPLAVLVWLADVVETTALLDLLLTWSITVPSLGRWSWTVLMVATWTKWIGLGAALAWLSRTLDGRTRWLVALPLPLSLGAFVVPAYLAEGMALAVLLAFVVLIARALGERRAGAQVHPGPLGSP